MQQIKNYWARTPDKESLYTAMIAGGLGNNEAFVAFHEDWKTAETPQGMRHVVLNSIDNLVWPRYNRATGNFEIEVCGQPEIILLNDVSAAYANNVIVTFNPIH
jgi:hypothetical protein